MKTAMTRTGCNVCCASDWRAQENQLGHQAWRVEGGSPSRKNDAETLPLLIEGLDVIGQGLVRATMALVLVGMRQEIAMKLLDVIFGQRDRIPVREDRIHHLSISPRPSCSSRGRERPEAKIGQETFDPRDC